MIKGQAIKEDDGVAIELEVEGLVKDLKIETAMIVKAVIEQITKQTGFNQELITGQILIGIFNQLDSEIIAEILAKLEGACNEANRD